MVVYSSRSSDCAFLVCDRIRADKMLNALCAGGEQRSVALGALKDVAMVRSMKGHSDTARSKCQIQVSSDICAGRVWALSGGCGRGCEDGGGRARSQRWKWKRRKARLCGDASVFSPCTGLVLKILDGLGSTFLAPFYAF